MACVLILRTGIHNDRMRSTQSVAVVVVPMNFYISLVFYLDICLLHRIVTKIAYATEEETTIAPHLRSWLCFIYITNFYV